jgi:hypothetical protein
LNRAVCPEQEREEGRATEGREESEERKRKVRVAKAGLTGPDCALTGGDGRGG